jgi:RNA polymerase sigma factor (sigma-70 family)
MAPELDFEKLVELHYQSLYRFAMSLTRNETEACDLTQQTFFILAKNIEQLRDREKAKSWLFTTLHREFLGRRRKMIRFQEVEVSEAEAELPTEPARPEEADAPALLRALGQIDPVFQSAVSLFYLEDYSYGEIAEILNAPLGTVKSRIARGIGQLQRLLVDSPTALGKGLR